MKDKTDNGRIVLNVKKNSWSLVNTTFKSCSRLNPSRLVVIRYVARTAQMINGSWMTEVLIIILRTSLLFSDLDEAPSSSFR